MDDDLAFLRDKARQCREFALYHDGAAAEGLTRMAEELEARAAEIEQRMAAVRAAVRSHLLPSRH